MYFVNLNPREGFKFYQTYLLSFTILILGSFQSYYYSIEYPLENTTEDLEYEFHNRNISTFKQDSTQSNMSLEFVSFNQYLITSVLLCISLGELTEPYSSLESRFFSVWLDKLNFKILISSPLGWTNKIKFLNLQNKGINLTKCRLRQFNVPLSIIFLQLNGSYRFRPHFSYSILIRFSLLPVTIIVLFPSDLMFSYNLSHVRNDYFQIHISCSQLSTQSEDGISDDEMILLWPLSSPSWGQLITSLVSLVCNHASVRTELSSSNSS